LRQKKQATTIGSNCLHAKRILQNSFVRCNRYATPSHGQPCFILLVRPKVIVVNFAKKSRLLKQRSELLVSGIAVEKED